MRYDGPEARVEGPLIPSYLPPGHDPFAAAERPPDALAYFRAYCVVSALICGAGVALCAVTAFTGFRSSPRGPDDWIALSFCVFGALVCAAIGSAYVFGATAPRRPWMHTFGLVLLVVSLLGQSCCFPIGVILLLQWIKPEVKAWFQGPAPRPPA
jgi:hypothetical protein